MTRRLALLVPGDPDTRTGGYGYDRRIAAGLAARDWRVDTICLSETFPFPTSAALAHADDVLARERDGAIVLADGLAFGAMPAPVRRHAARLRLVALVHHPLALETGLSPGQASTLARSEREALAAARHVVVTSRGTADLLADWHVAPDRLSIVEPGTDPAPLARGSGEPASRLLTVASLTPRKGFDVLASALGAVSERRWRLTVVGSLTRDAPTANAFLAALTRLGLAERVELAGELDRAGVDRAYDTADAFVLSSRLEGYGMVVAEAIARGLPVVATDTGAIADLVGRDAGLVVPTGDAASLADALGRLLDDDALRTRLTAGARARRAQLPDWDVASDLMAATLSRVADA